MYFTQEDYRKIEAWLKSRAVKDSEFMQASPLNGKEWVAILQDGHNKKIKLDSLFHQIIKYNTSDLVNLTITYNLGKMSLGEAIDYVPEKQRYYGKIVTFMNPDGLWEIWQYVAFNNEGDWYDKKNWERLKSSALEPDEEDLTRDIERNEIKFKDKQYSEIHWSGLGRKYLRKNMKTQCLPGDYSKVNILRQEDFDQENTIYIIQYDYCLQGETITVPEGCVLWFQGGRLKNGTLNTNGAALWGIDSTDDCVLQDNPAIIEVSNSHRGELLTFYEPSGFKLVGEDKEFYIENDTNLYQKIDDTYFKSIYRQSPENIYDTETPVQQLKWYNGTEWIPLLDERDYNNIRKEIKEFYGLIRYDVQRVFNYYTPYLKKYDLMLQYINSSDSGNNKGKNIKWTIDDLYDKIGNLDLTEINNKNTEQDESITELNNKVAALEKVKPVKSVSVNGGNQIKPDDTGNVNLPIEFPEIPEFDTTEIEERLEALEESNVELEKKDNSIEDEISEIKELESLNETFIFKLNKEIAYYTYNTGTLEKDGNYYILPGNDGKGNFFYNKSDKFKVEYRKYKPEGASWWATEFRFVISPKKVGDKTMTFVFGGLDCTFTNPYADNILCWKDIQYYNDSKRGILDEGHLPKTSVQYSGPTLIVSYFFNKKGDGAQIYGFFAYNINGQPLLKEANIVINGYWR